MVKVLVSDVDGTISKFKDGKNIIGNKVKAVLKRFDELNDLHFILATGRNIQSLSMLLRENDIDLKNCMYITENGTHIYNHKFELIYEKYLSNDIVNLILEYLYTIEDDFKLKITIRTTVEQLQYVNDEQINNISGRVNSICVRPLNRSEDEANTLVEKLNHFSNNVSISKNKCYVDIIPLDVSKSTAVNYIMSQENIGGTIYAIGDSYNDIPLFELANTSFSFRDSPIEVQDYASYILDDFSCIENYIK